MIYAFDSYYFGDRAKTVCIAFENWDSETEAKIFTQTTAVAANYESGAFYKRELPCILSLLRSIELKKDDLIIVDGYVTLDNTGKIGLGGHLFESLERKFTVVGIAKNGFNSEDDQRRNVYRGESKTPLFVTAIGADVDELH